MSIKRILIVDDSPTERLAIVEMLSSDGFQVITAKDGEEALTISARENPDLILMDVVMPGTNGFQATRQLNRQQQTRSIPVVMCTSKSEPVDRIWAMRQGASDYLVKPIQKDALMQVIQRLDQSTPTVEQDR